MQDDRIIIALTALLVVFICLFAAGVIVYAVFFAIHKKNFAKLVNVIKKFNDLINGLNGINIFKIQVLANNDIGNKLELNKYTSIYHKLKQNSSVIRNNIATAEVELNAFNLQVAKRYIASIDHDLTEALTSLKQLKEAYTNYTSYGSTIESMFQNYLEIYEHLAYFYEKKLNYTDSFKRVNDLFDSIKKTFISLPKLSIEFDYKKTIDTVVDLGSKLGTLADAVLLILRFQLVDLYLQTTKDYNEKIISKHFDEIARSDLQTLQNLQTLFAHAYMHFNQHYRGLELGKAQAFAVQALDALRQINQFTYIHVNTPTYIALSINEIKEQSDKIIANKNDIINSITDLKQYFVLEPQISACFDTITRDVKHIAALNEAANHVNYQTHNEKIKAVEILDNIGNQIVARKLEIINAIDTIDDMLAKVIKTVTDLNDLYIYFWQLLSAIEQFAPANSETDDMKQLIKTSLKQIDGYSTQIISQEKPDFDKIAYEICSIVEQSQQMYKRMSTTIVLKSYASKLFVYANRYKQIKELHDDFAKASNAFNTKNYGQCIDILLKIVRTAKKYKN